MKLPTVAVSTILTNPFSSCYYAYLAFIESWAPFVDEIILVDGGTTDNSFEIAKNWVSPQVWAKVRIISNDKSYWHPGDNWHALQAMGNYQLGFEASVCDWVITINADMILYEETGCNLRSELAKNADADAVFFYRGKKDPSGVILRRIDHRATIVNKKMSLRSPKPFGFGVLTTTRAGYDFAMHIDSKSFYTDPTNNSVRTILSGVPILQNTIIDVECGVFGHFFFDDDSALLKLQRWSNTFARYQGTSFSRKGDLQLVNRSFGRPICLPSDKLPDETYPTSIKRVIAEYYKKGMFGGLVSANGRTVHVMKRLLEGYYTFDRKIRTKYLRTRGLKGLREYHHWVFLEDDDFHSVNVSSVYKLQDKLLEKQ